MAYIAFHARGGETGYTSADGRFNIDRKAHDPLKPEGRIDWSLFDTTGGTKHVGTYQFLRDAKQAAFDILRAEPQETQASAQSDYKLERYDKDSQRVKLDGDVVAMALRMTNNRWGIFDRDQGVRVIPLTYETPKLALKAYVESVQGE